MSDLYIVNSNLWLAPQHRPETARIRLSRFLHFATTYSIWSFHVRLLSNIMPRNLAVCSILISVLFTVLTDDDVLNCFVLLTYLLICLRMLLAGLFSCQRAAKQRQARQSTRYRCWQMLRSRQPIAKQLKRIESELTEGVSNSTSRFARSSSCRSSTVYR